MESQTLNVAASFLGLRNARDGAFLEPIKLCPSNSSLKTSTNLNDKSFSPQTETESTDCLSLDLTKSSIPSV